VTPGGIGVNELASVTALKLFGTPLSIAAQWAVANRILCTASCFLVAGFAGMAFAGWKIGAASPPTTIGDTNAGFGDEKTVL